MRKYTKLLCALVTIFVAYVTVAVEVTPEQAQTAVRNWIRKNPRPMTAQFATEDGEAKPFTKDGKVLFHVIQLEGGGFVVTSGDTKISPIIAFSDGGTFDPDPQNPLFALLNRDMSARLDSVATDESQAQSNPLRLKVGISTPSSSALVGQEKTDNEIAWDKLLEEPSVLSRGIRLNSVSSMSQLDDVRVEPMIKTEWDQSTWGNYSNTPNTYNYNTPGHSVCGCVATAGAQVMNFWQYPKNSVPKTNCKYYYNNQEYSATIGGEKYAWSSMPVSYAASKTITEAQIKAVGRLTYEVGVASSMSYSTEDSGTWGCILMRSLKSVFGYASAVGIVTDYDIGNRINDNIRNSVLASLDAGMPGTIGVFSQKSGHEIVTDGYGFNKNTLYVHLNCGWSGSQNAWYQLFGEKLTSHNFYNIGEVCFNIHPTEIGDVVSGRVVGNNGAAVANAVVTMTQSTGSSATTKTNSKGIYAFRVTKAGEYYVEASSSGMTSKRETVRIEKLSQSADVYSYLGKDQDGKDSVCFDYYSTVGHSANRWGVDLTLESANDVIPDIPVSQVAAPTFSPAAGTFTSSSISVTLSCGTSGAVIYYTQNGSTPTTSSTKYTGAVTISSTTTFKAIAVKSGMANSDVVSKTYTKGTVSITPAQGMDWSGSVTVSDSSLVSGQNDITHDGTDAAQLKSAKATTATITVNGPGTLSFWWAADQLSMFDYFDLLVDGTEKISKEGVAWKYESIPIAAGSHSVQWKLRNPWASMVSSTARGFIDEVSFASYSGGTCKVTYYSNGADGGYLAKGSDSGTFASSLSVPGCGTLYKDGYAFLGWSTSQTATKAQYRSGNTMSFDVADRKLYAVWKKCITLLAEIPQAGGDCEVTMDKCYGSSYIAQTATPDWAANFKLKAGSTTVTCGSGWTTFGFSPDSDISLVFSADANDTANDRYFDLDLDALTYSYVIRCHVVQKADVTSSKARQLVVEAENGGGFSAGESVVGGSSEKFVARIVRRNSAVDNVSASWSIVSGGTYATLSGGTLTAKEVDSPRTVKIRATYSESGVTYTADREVTIKPKSTDATCSISLPTKGWNLVSFNVLPDNPSPDVVFADVSGKIQSVVSGTKRWTPDSGGRLTELKIGVGYWVKTTADNVSWTVTGTPDEAATISVSSGWNLIGYPLLESGAPEVVLKSAAAAGLVESIVSGTKRWTPTSGGRLTEMMPGVGYWLKAAKSGTIKFDK